MKKLTIKHYKKQLKDMEYYNSMAPFNVYDSEDVNDLKKLIKRMESKEYDKEPVVACKYCNNLHIVTDELDNNVCMKCGSVNELKEYSNIEEYLKKVNTK
jgi:hypothetical protein